MRFFVMMLVVALAFSSVDVFAKEEATKKEDVKSEAKPEVKAEVKEETQAVKSAVPVVTVNGKVVSEDEVTAEVEKRITAHKKQSIARGQEMPEAQIQSLRQRLHSSVIDMLIEREIVMGELAARKLTLDDAMEDFNKQLAEIAAKENKTVDEIIKEIETNMFMSIDDLKEQVKLDRGIKKLIEAEMKEDAVVSEEEAKTFYDENPKYFTQAEKD